ncbi:MAG: hypothetical protein WC712_12110 [Candidatus Brocadiia bacterium]
MRRLAFVLCCLFVALSLACGGSSGTVTPSPSPSPSPSPTATPTLAPVEKALAGGSSHSLILGPGGSVWACGNNAFGQLGIGTVMGSRETPVLVTALNDKGVIALAAGGNFSLALCSDGTVYSWGNNAYGQLGLGDAAAGANKDLPELVTGLSGKTVVSLATGFGHSLALCSDRTVYSWGANKYGALGLGDTTNRNDAQLIAFLSDKGVMGIAAGFDHSLAICSDGSIYAWGWNSSGQLGLDDTTDRHVPTLLASLDLKFDSLVTPTLLQIAAGRSFSAVLLTDGTVYTWGSNDYGQLGLGDLVQRLTPTLVSGFAGKGITSISAANYSLAAIGSGALVYVTGRNTYGELGLGDNTDRNTPELVAALSGQGITELGGGQMHFLAHGAGWIIFAWGLNGSSQLGVGDDLNRDVPTEITALPGKSRGTIGGGDTHTVIIEPGRKVCTVGANDRGQLGLGHNVGANMIQRVTALSCMEVVSVVADDYQTFALCSDGSVYAWGWNEYGQLGLGDNVNKTTPEIITGLSGHTVVDMAIGAVSAAVVCSDGEVYTWGINSSGQLGLGDTIDHNTPQLVATLSDKGVIRVASGGGTCLALCADGSVYGWGWNQYGELGLGDNDHRESPVLLSWFSGIDIVDIVAGYQSSFFVASDGAIYGCGYNEYGHLGLGTTAYIVNTPTLVTAFAGKGVVSIVSGYALTLALCADGSVYSCGAASYGQLGVGESGNLSVPTLIPTLSGKGVIEIAVGNFHCVVRCSDGYCYAWGYNNPCGQLGLGDNLDRNTPQLLDPRTAKIQPAVATGREHSVFLMPDGKVYTSGRNVEGQLGLGDNANVGTPVQVSLLDGKGVIAVAAGCNSSYALCLDGSVYAWGSNSMGNLGIGNYVDQNTPQLVTGLSGEKVTAIAAGSYHMMALCLDGSVYVWGYSWLDGIADESVPQEIPALSSLGVIAMAGGDSHALVLCSDGSVYAWGANNFGSLGIGDDYARTMPNLVPALSGLGVKAIGTCWDSSFAITSDGKVYSWGGNFYGELGLGNTAERYSPQHAVAFDGLNIVRLSGGYNFLLAMGQNGAIYACGIGGDGQVGQGDYADYSLPQNLTGLNGQNVICIAAGGYHSMACCSDGSFFGWGFNGEGQLGLGDIDSRNVPVVLPAFSSKPD